MNKKLTKYVHSLIAIPMLAFSLPSASLPSGIMVNFASEQNTSVAIVEEKLEAPVTPDYRAVLIDEYFGKKNLPMAGFGQVFVEAADKYKIDWRLLPALAMRESTGGKFACGGKLSAEWNPWGWNSCKGNGFKSMEDSIDTLAKHLSGNHERTKHYYHGKDLKGVLQTYNPPSVVEKYAYQVMAIMKKIAPAEKMVAVPMQLPSVQADAVQPAAVEVASI